MKALTIFEYDRIVAQQEGQPKDGEKKCAVPKPVFEWLKEKCLRSSDKSNDEASGWLKMALSNGREAIQVTNYAGVLRAPCGFQIEVLPKTGKGTTPEQAQKLLIQMIKCLAGFRHIQTNNADLHTERMPLMEVFIQQFLAAVNSVVKRGLRSDYVAQQDNLFAVRGKLLIAQQITQNLVCRDRFFTEHDEFSQNRPANRLIHTALRHVLAMCRSPENQRLARELSFVFADIPMSTDVAQDVQRVRLDRGMSYYESAIVWAKLILQGFSPVSSAGNHDAPSLLFPMQALFEAYVEKHLAKQLQSNFVLKAQASGKHLVRHDGQYWFRLKPDLLVKDGKDNCLVLDAKWKLLDSSNNNGSKKYNLSQADFYQLYAYGHHYLNGSGVMVLIYPKTDAFNEPLPEFKFPSASGMQLLVLPFCLESCQLLLPSSKQLSDYFSKANS